MTVHSYIQKIVDEYIYKLKKKSESEKKSALYLRAIEWLHWLQANHKITESEFQIYSNSLLSAAGLEREKVQIIHKPSSYAVNFHTYVLYSILGFLLLWNITLSYLVFNQIHKNVDVNDYKNIQTYTYRGILVNKENEPITERTDVYFSIYADNVGNKKIYEGKCIGGNGIVPNYLGEFSIQLGKDCAMKSLPTLPQSSYLGVRISNGKELRPLAPIEPADQLTRTSLPSQVSFNDKSGNITIPNGMMQIMAQKNIIQSTDNQAGTIEFQPGTHTIFSTGNVGIGTVQPEAKLDVRADVPFASVASFINTSIEDDQRTSVLNLSLGTQIKGYKSRFINFFAGAQKDLQGSLVGSIRLHNKGVSYETKGADFAEYFKTIENEWAQGEIAGIGENGVVRATNENVFAGIVTSHAGFIGNIDNSESSVLLGLRGQLPVIVQNDIYKPGDRICMSSVAGIGTRCKSSDLHPIGYVLPQQADFSLFHCGLHAMDNPEIVTKLMCKKVIILI